MKCAEAPIGLWELYFCVSSSMTSISDRVTNDSLTYSEPTYGQGEKEGQPTERKHADHNSQSFCCFLLPGEFEKFHRERTSGLVRAALARACAGALLLHLRAFVDPEGQLAGVHPLAHHTCLQVLSCPFSDYVHAAVHGQYDDERDVKGAEGREERVKRLLGDGALRVVRRRRLLPPEQRTDGDDHRQRPYPEHGQQSPLLRHDARVLQRVTHSDVAVDGYYAQAHDGRGAAQHIHRRPDVTEDPSEHPVV